MVLPPRPPPSASLPAHFAPRAPFRHLAPRFFLSRDQPSHIRSREEVQDRLAAPPVDKEVPDLALALPPASLTRWERMLQ